MVIIMTFNEHFYMAGSELNVTHMTQLWWQHSELGSIKIPLVWKLEKGRSLIQGHIGNDWQDQNLFQGVGHQNPHR